MSLVGSLSILVYWLAKIYFMVFGIIYIFALLGRFDMGLFTNLTGIIGILFLLSNIYYYAKGGGG